MNTIKILSVLAILVLSFAGIWYVTGLRADLAVSEENSRQLNNAVQMQQEVLIQIKQEQEQIRKISDGLTEQVNAQNKDVDALRDRFITSSSGKSRDLGKLAIEKPALVEKIINNASMKALRCLELSSGSKLKEGETNEECPAIVNSAN